MYRVLELNVDMGYEKKFIKTEIAKIVELKD